MLTVKKFCEEILQIKDIIVENIKTDKNVKQEMILKLTVRPSRAAENRCPVCGIVFALGNLTSMICYPYELFTRFAQMRR